MYFPRSLPRAWREGEKKLTRPVDNDVSPARNITLKGIARDTCLQGNLDKNYTLRMFHAFISTGFNWFTVMLRSRCSCGGKTVQKQKEIQGENIMNIPHKRRKQPEGEH